MGMIHTPTRSTAPGLLQEITRQLKQRGILPRRFGGTGGGWVNIAIHLGVQLPELEDKKLKNWARKRVVELAKKPTIFGSNRLGSNVSQGRIRKSGY
jgi:hypothetical protein